MTWKVGPVSPISFSSGKTTENSKTAKASKALSSSHRVSISDRIEGVSSKKYSFCMCNTGKVMPSAKLKMATNSRRSNRICKAGSNGLFDRSATPKSFPNGLLYACLVEAFGYLKGPVDMLQYYDQRYKTAVAKYAIEQIGRRRRDDYFDGAIRIKIDSPSA